MILFTLSEIGTSSRQLYLRWIPRNCLSSQDKEGRRTCDSQNSAHWGSKHQTGFSETCEPRRSRRSPYPVIHPQDEYVFSTQLLWIGKTELSFCFHFLLPLASTELKASYRTKSAVYGGQGSPSSGHVVVTMNFDLDLQSEEAENSLIGGQLASAAGLSPKGMNRKCQVWTSCPALFGHLKNSFRNFIPTMTCEAVGPVRPSRRRPHEWIKPFKWHLDAAYLHLKSFNRMAFPRGSLSTLNQTRGPN